jgi:hypothetical protein
MLVDVKTDQIYDFIQLPGGALPNIPAFDGSYMWVTSRNGADATLIFKLLAPR